MSLKTELREATASQIEELKKFNVGTEEYESCVEAIGKLADKLIELEKLDQDVAIKTEENQIKNKELHFKYQQLESEKKQHKMSNYILIGTTASGVALTVWGALCTWKYEETGVIASGPGKKFMDRILNLAFKK